MLALQHLLNQLLAFSRFVGALDGSTSCHSGADCSVVAALPTVSAAEGGRRLAPRPSRAQGDRSQGAVELGRAGDRAGDRGDGEGIDGGLHGQGEGS